MKTKDDFIYSSYLVLRCLEYPRQHRQAVEAFGLLVEHWQPRLLGYIARKIDCAESAPDLVQETLIAVSERLHKLQDAEAFPKWLYQIANNKCSDWIRQQQRRRRDLDVHRAQAESGNSTSTCRGSDQQLLLQAFKQLPKEQYEIVRLFYLQEFGIAEISSLMAIPEGTVKSRLFKARSTLKNILTEV